MGSVFRVPVVLDRGSHVTCLLFQRRLRVGGQRVVCLFYAKVLLSSTLHSIFAVKLGTGCIRY